MVFERKSAVPEWWQEKTAKKRASRQKRVKVSPNIGAGLLSVAGLILAYQSLSSDSAFQKWQKQSADKSAEVQAKSSAKQIEHEIMREARWQAERCLTIALFAANRAANASESSAKHIINAASNLDPACGNIGELASNFRLNSQNFALDRGRRSGSARTIPTVRLSDDFARGEVKTPNRGGSAGSDSYPPSRTFSSGASAILPEHGQPQPPPDGNTWESPFGPFRIDMNKVLVADEDGEVTFNVGTQF